MAGLLDRLKGLVKDREGQIKSAVDKAGDFVDDKTKGKYHDKIAKAGEKTGQVIDKVKADGTPADGAAATADAPADTAAADTAAASPTTDVPGAHAAADDAPGTSTTGDAATAADPTAGTTQDPTDRPSA